MSTYYNISMFNTGDYGTYNEALEENAVYTTPSTVDCVTDEGGNTTGAFDLLEVIDTMKSCFSLTGVCAGVVTNRGFITLEQIVDDEGQTPISDIKPEKGNEKRLTASEFATDYGYRGIACILAPEKAFGIHSKTGAALLESRGYIERKASNGSYGLTHLGEDMKNKIVKLF
jgi:hypothetical protein